VVRIAEILQHSHDQPIAYSSLTRLVRQLELKNSPKRAGTYDFGPGVDSQHDTSPHRVSVGGKVHVAQCAGFALTHCRRLFIQYYPRFTRFEAKVFLDAAFAFMDGTTPVVTIDNTSVIVADGSGPDAIIAPEMEAFGAIFSLRFVPHAIGHCDRKAVIERDFSYVENNFLSGRTFIDWQDLNSQAKQWCIQVANAKIKRSLSMSPEQAYIMEKPYLQPLPVYRPPVYQCLYRIVDLYGYVSVDTNRYSVPESLVQKNVEVHKHWDHIQIRHEAKLVAEHARVMDGREIKVRAPGHHRPQSRSVRRGPSPQFVALSGHNQTLDAYVNGLKNSGRGQGRRKLQRLLELKRSYPETAFLKAIDQALAYGMYDVNRLESMILEHLVGDFFNIEDEP
jgi:hypothetical protein